MLNKVLFHLTSVGSEIIVIQVICVREVRFRTDEFDQGDRGRFGLGATERMTATRQTLARSRLSSSSGRVIFLFTKCLSRYRTLMPADLLTLLRRQTLSVQAIHMDRKLTIDDASLRDIAATFDVSHETIPSFLPAS